MAPANSSGSQSARLLASLKVALKAAGITYGEVAEHLGLSLSSVKRQLSRGGLSMERYEQIAALAGIDLLELARQAEAARGQLSQLSEAQEQALVADEALLLAAVCVLNRWRMQDLQDVYGFSEPEAVGLLTRLDALGLIELLPGNRIKLRSARNFSWRPFGPIHQYFVREHQNQFLGGRFSARTDAYQFRFGMITEESAAELSSTIEALLEKFQHLSQRDEIRPRGEGAGTCLLVAMREWEPKAFAALKAL